MGCSLNTPLLYIYHCSQYDVSYHDLKTWLHSWHVYHIYLNYYKLYVSLLSRRFILTKDSQLSMSGLLKFVKRLLSISFQQRSGSKTAVLVVFSAPGWFNTSFYWEDPCSSGLCSLPVYTVPASSTSTFVMTQHLVKFLISNHRVCVGCICELFLKYMISHVLSITGLQKVIS